PFRPNVSAGGTYDVYAWFPTISKGSPSTPFLIAAVGTNRTIIVSQVSGSGGWRLLASGLNFNQGTNGFVRVANNSGQGGKNVVADAVRWVYGSAQVVLAPMISGQPQSLRAIAGFAATFEVAAD